MLGGWATAFLSTDSEETEEFIAHIEMAEEYVSRGLFQKAIEEYDAALLIKNTEEVWTAKLDAYKNRYAESTKIYEDYLAAAQMASATYVENVDYVIVLANLYLVREEYSSAYKVLKNAVESGLDDEKVNELYIKTKYSYELKWDAYENYRTCVNGYYAVSDAGVWSYIEENGEKTVFVQLAMAGPVGEGGIRVLQDKTRSQLIDTNEVVQSILDFEPKDAGCFSEGLVAIQREDCYSYYNVLGDKQFGNYDMAGTFVNGVAAVQQEDKWILIDTQGNQISEETYEDIILHVDGTHIKNGVMIAKTENGVMLTVKDKNLLLQHM